MRRFVGSCNRLAASLRHYLLVIPSPGGRLASLGIVLAVAASLAACGRTVPPASPVAPLPTTAGASTASSPPPASLAVPSDEPSIAPGFAFDPESIVGYYESIGFACGERQPSESAAGFEYQSCQLVDANARTLSLGVVTDPADNVADAFLSVRGSEAETVLDPAAVLEPFAAFLGAFLGEATGTELLPWLAAHLGDAESRTSLGHLTIATYTAASDDHRKLTLEIASRAYLDAPRPSAGPATAPSSARVRARARGTAGRPAAGSPRNDRS